MGQAKSKANAWGRALVVSVLMGLGSLAHAQSIDSTAITAGSPPLPTGVWDANAAASELTTSLATQSTTITNNNNTANNAYSLASAAAVSAGSAVVVTGQEPGAYQGYGITSEVYGLCESSSREYNISVANPAYPTTPGDTVCPPSAPYFYQMYTITVDNDNQGGGNAD